MSDYLYNLEQELKTVKLQRNELLKSLKSLIDWVPSETTQCRGDKCRELYCESCYGEKTAQETIDDLQQMVDKAKVAISNAKGEK
jgi:hypothetical protein